MCTISWQAHAGGYDLFFTRDEQRSRAKAEAPRAHESPEGVNYLAPIDPVGGGTWIFVNQHGLTGALLNAYELDEAAPKIQSPESRGQLLRSLASTDCIQTFATSLTKRLALHAYPPCYLFAMKPDGAAALWLWNGRALAALPVPDLQFFTTSSYRPAEVCTYRSEQFKGEIGQPPHSPKALENFHRNEDNQLSAFDVRMSRREACSVSLTRIRCHHHDCSIHYAPREGDGPFDHARVTKLKEKRSTPELQTK